MEYGILIEVESISADYIFFQEKHFGSLVFVLNELSKGGWKLICKGREDFEFILAREVV